MKQSTKNFLRPDIKKIIVFLLIIGPPLAELIARMACNVYSCILPSHPLRFGFIFPFSFSSNLYNIILFFHPLLSEFYIINAWFCWSMGISIFFLAYIMGGGPEGARLARPLLALLSIPLYIIGVYYFSCLIVGWWNKFFSLFSKKMGWVIKIALLLLFVLLGIILPAINSLLL